MSQTTPFKVTYATLSADDQALQGQLDEGLARVQARLGENSPLWIGGRPVHRAGELESLSPLDTGLVLGRVSQATQEDVMAAVAAAREAFPGWRATPWEERCAVVERAARLIREERAELTAWLILENGKNRVEALGEIEETADLYDYYAQQMRENRGFVHEMGRLSPADTNTSALRPYGVWGVIAPWNFPYALLGAPVAAALVTGNTVVCKPSSDTPLSAVRLVDIFHRAGAPAGTVNLVVGGGAAVGTPLIGHPDLAGLTFTGSYEVGFQRIYRTFSARYPKPCIVEMGGKNPALVMDTADLDRAVTGVWRSAFGMGGQKCSACSRVYLHRDIAEAFLERLARKTRETIPGDPRRPETFLGPVGTQGGYQDFLRHAEMARRDGQVLAGAVLPEAPPNPRGLYVSPTLVAGLPEDHPLMTTELFLPFLCAQTVDSLDEALERANRSDFGLTAGFFSSRPEEIERFQEEIEAGVVYINRAAGATTGAWPGVQPFGGWKGSGSTGKNIGGLYTLQCYLREQSRTLTR